MTNENIRGAVNVALLDKADRLFRNDDKGIWIEVIQNARRAGALRIDISIEETSPRGDSCTVTLTDNGRGITDFQTLVTLGRSEWPDETEAAEDPAGMGFFSLCHSDVEVHSGRKYVRISRAVFLGKAIAEIEEREEFVAGTRLRFQRPSTRKALVDALERVTEFLPLEVYLEGIVLPRHDFLDGALYRERINGVEVGFATSFTFGDHDYYDLNWNFYGARLRHAPMVLRGLIGEDGRVASISARYEVLQTGAVKLQLPDRKGILEDDAFREFQQKAAAAAYRTFQSAPHVLSYRHWRQAKTLGIELPEAAPLLQSWAARSQDDDLEPIFEQPKAEVLSSLENVILVAEDIPNPHTLDAALHTGATLNGILYRENPDFRGYSWYDRLPMITDTVVFLDGCTYEEWREKSQPLRPSSIELEITMEQEGRTSDMRLPALVHVDSESYNNVQFVAVQNSPWDNENLRGPFSLVDFFMSATFSPSDDVEADSWETQEQAYRDDVEQEVNEYFRGPRASLRGILRGAITWQANRLVEQLGVEEIHFKRTGKEWNIDLLDAKGVEVPPQSTNHV